MIVIAFINHSCTNTNNNEEEQISTEVIQNPKTANGKDETGKLPILEFEETEHDFGKIIEGEIVTYGFKFKNTGKTDLLISTVSTSCGCTASEYPKHPIKKNKEGIIKITFNSKGRTGFQRKSAVVLANTQPNRTVLRIKAVVFNPEDL